MPLTKPRNSSSGDSRRASRAAHRRRRWRCGKRRKSWWNSTKASRERKRKTSMKENTISFSCRCKMAVIKLAAMHYYLITKKVRLPSAVSGLRNWLLWWIQHLWKNSIGRKVCTINITLYPKPKIISSKLSLDLEPARDQRICSTSRYLIGKNFLEVTKIIADELF